NREKLCFSSLVFICILITAIDPVLSQTSNNSCILDIQSSPSKNKSSCDSGNWGGFISNSCCTYLFNGYLHALGQHANQTETGQIFLNSTQQSSCLTEMKQVDDEDVSSCGVERLTSGASGCSTYTTMDVVNKFGDGLKNLDEDCKPMDSEGKSEEVCSGCLRRWEEIGGSSNNNATDSDSEANICRFAVLVTLISTKIDTREWPQTIVQCLARQNGFAGNVYRGILSNGSHVAVKHIVKDKQAAETFVREGDEYFLVYELCHNGNLSEWLYAGKDRILSWPQRLQIAIDSAWGLWFLHSYPEGCIVHRDIKPTNILIDTEFQAKLADFGLSKVMDVGQSYVSSEVRGTFGYVDPEYQRNHHVNAKGDVYSFGIVLLQLISGQRAKVLARGGKVTEFADPKLNGEYSVEAFDLVMKLALTCTGPKQERPSMDQVILRLKKALNISIQ
ncbi:hypothetical protein Tsubulata_027702, partial [Turnera subulata]